MYLKNNNLKITKIIPILVLGHFDDVEIFADEKQFILKTRDAGLVGTSSSFYLPVALLRAGSPRRSSASTPSSYPAAMQNRRWASSPLIVCTVSSGLSGSFYRNAMSHMMLSLLSSSESISTKASLVTVSPV